VLRRLLLVGLVVTSVGLWSAPASADEGWIIQRFASDITIQKDASLHIIEAIDVDFGAQEKHGIFRNIPVRYRWDDTNLRVYRLEVRSVTDAAGKPVRYETSDEEADKVIRIGDPDRTVSGPQTYRITYDVFGAMNAFGDHDEVFWNVNGGRWDVRAQAVTATVRVAGGLRRATCFQGRTGSQETCRSSTTATTADFAATRAFLPNEQLTIVTAVAKGTVEEPTPIIERDRSNPRNFFDTQPVFVGLTWLTLLGGLGWLSWRWFTLGRDKRRRHTIVPEYEPPDRIRPAQAGLLMDESADTKDVTATIVDLAVRGYLVIEELPRTGLFAKKDWNLAKTAKAPRGLVDFESTVYKGLFPRRTEVKISALREHFVSTLKKAENELYAESKTRGWFARRPDQTRILYLFLAILLIVVGVVIIFVLGALIGAGFVGLAVLLVGIAALPVARIMPAKTAAGAELHRRTLGFERYMNVAEKERAKFAERENIFSEYLPYAIVFGCVERWARAFKDIDTAAQTATWYTGTSTVNSLALSSSLQGFSSNVGSAIVATPGSKGGSGFSGGGGAGGGGGGGGGGSW